MTKQELIELAKIGAREEVKNLQARADALYRQFPDLMPGPPVLVRPELRHARNGSGPDITTLPQSNPNSKISGLLPYLLQHGPSRVQVVAKALKLKSAGSMSSALVRYTRAGLIEHAGIGVYGLTAAGHAAVGKPTRGNKPPVQKKKKAAKIAAQRERTDQLLKQVESDGPLTLEAIGARGFKVQGIGSLVRRKYLKKTDDGYARTAKVYEP